MKQFNISIEHLDFDSQQYEWEHLETYWVYQNGLKIQFSTKTIFIKKNMISQDDYGLLWKQLLLREIPRQKHQEGKKWTIFSILFLVIMIPIVSYFGFFKGDQYVPKSEDSLENLPIKIHKIYENTGDHPSFLIQMKAKRNVFFECDMVFYPYLKQRYFDLNIKPDANLIISMESDDFENILNSSDQDTLYIEVVELRDTKWHYLKLEEYNEVKKKHRQTAYLKILILGMLSIALGMLTWWWKLKQWNRLEDYVNFVENMLVITPNREISRVFQQIEK